MERSDLPAWRRPSLAAVFATAALWPATVYAEPPSLAEADRMSPDALLQTLMSDRAGSYSRVDTWAHSPSGRTLSQANFWSPPPDSGEPGVCEADFLMIVYQFGAASGGADRTTGVPRVEADTLYRAASGGVCDQVAPGFLHYFRAPSARSAAAALRALEAFRAEARGTHELRCDGAGCDDLSALVASLTPDRLQRVSEERCGPAPGSSQYCLSYYFFYPEPYSMQRLTLGPGSSAEVVTYTGYSVVLPPPRPPSGGADRPPS